jgi:hypothetical protein
MTLEGVKAAVERVTGWRRPSAEQLAKLLQSRRIATFRFVMMASFQTTHGSL